MIESGLASCIETNEVSQPDINSTFDPDKRLDVNITSTQRFSNEFDPDKRLGYSENVDSMPERYTSYEDRLKHTPNENSDLGTWEGERGESKFIPNAESEVGCIAKEKLSEYGMDGVEYKYAEPDFSACSEATVTIDNMTQNRENYIDDDGNYQLGNFAQADLKCADQWNFISYEGRTDWTAADIRDWRRENQYSWHECCDTSTMQLVSRDIHGTFKHSGGVAECKARDNVNIGGGFDE